MLSQQETCDNLLSYAILVLNVCSRLLVLLHGRWFPSDVTAGECFRCRQMIIGDTSLPVYDRIIWHEDCQCAKDSFIFTKQMRNYSAALPRTKRICWICLLKSEWSEKRLGGQVSLKIKNVTSVKNYCWFIVNVQSLSLALSYRMPYKIWPYIQLTTIL